MIRNAVIHQHGQLPLLVDLRALPTTSDVSVVCTNVRTTDNKRPSFIDDSSSWFLIPLATVTFIEVPRASVTESGEEPPAEPEAVPAPPPEPQRSALDEEPAFALEPDEDLLARIREL
ncbi:MAG: hypothetical protein M3N29_06585 [Chloroflexota bacterium]|nr:hypothetical protein [Chloroflexota bacterium]